VATALLASPAVAQFEDDEESVVPRMGPALWVGFGHSDNIRRASDETRSSYEALGVYLDAGRERERLAAGITMDLQVRKYELEDLEDDQIGSIEAFTNVEVVPRLFTWVFDEAFGQGRQDPFAPVGPGNLQNINVFATGPEFLIPLGQRTELSLTGLLTDRRHEETESFNSRSTAYELGLLRQVGPVTRAGILVESDDVDYQFGELVYTIRGAVLHYERDFSTGDVLAEIGRNEVISGGTALSGPRINLMWRRAVGARSRLGISASKEFTDAGAFFAFNVTDALVGRPEDVVLSPSPLEQKRLEIFYEFSTPRTFFTVGIGQAEEYFESDPTLDNDTSTIRLSLRRMLTTRSTLMLSAENVDRNFYDTGRNDGDRLATLTYDHRLSTRFSIQFDLVGYARRGTDSFDERRYEIRLRFEPGR